MRATKSSNAVVGSYCIAGEFTGVTDISTQAAPAWRSTAAARSGVVALLLQARCTGPSPALRANAATDSPTASDPDALPTSPHTDAGAVNRSAFSNALPIRVIANPYSSAR